MDKLFEDPMRKRLETVEAVIENLYGRPVDMARELDRSRSAVWQYQQREMLPGSLYKVIQEKARLHGCTVADELFTPVVVHPALVRKGA
jgi:hypothetical protein